MRFIKYLFSFILAIGLLVMGMLYFYRSETSPLSATPLLPLEELVAEGEYSSAVLNNHITYHTKKTESSSSNQSILVS